jgi:hypothetical protein
VFAPHGLFRAESFAIIVLPTCPACFAWTEASKEHQSNRRLSFELLAFLYASGVEDCSKLPVLKYPLC